MSNKELMNVNGETTRPHDRDDLVPSMRNMDEWMNNWNRWFDNFFNRFFDSPTFGGGLLPTVRSLAPWSGTFAPSINISESEKEFLVTVELPGVSENDIDLSVDNNTLTIKGEKRQDHEEKGTGWHRVERSYGTFLRTIPLPSTVDTSAIEAGFKQGVLSIHLPKLPESQTNAKKIQIKNEPDK